MKKLYYLATPYSHPDPGVRESRFHLACDVAGMLMNRGLHVFPRLLILIPWPDCVRFMEDLEP